MEKRKFKHKSKYCINDLNIIKSVIDKVYYVHIAIQDRGPIYHFI